METAQDVCPVCRTGKGETAQALRDVAKVVTDAMIEYGEISRAEASGVQAHIAKRIVETFGPLEPTR
jgi:polyhydroxyalkanoate synthesis regulator phasin